MFFLFTRVRIDTLCVTVWSGFPDDITLEALSADSADEGVKVLLLGPSDNDDLMSYEKPTRPILKVLHPRPLVDLAAAVSYALLLNESQWMGIIVKPINYSLKGAFLHIDPGPGLVIEETHVIEMERYDNAGVDHLKSTRSEDSVDDVHSAGDVHSSLYLKLDAKSLLGGAGLEDGGIQEVDMDMEDEDPASGLTGSEDGKFQDPSVPHVPWSMIINVTEGASSSKAICKPEAKISGNNLRNCDVTTRPTKKNRGQTKPVNVPQGLNFHAQTVADTSSNQHAKRVAQVWLSLDSSVNQ
ncbi:hypothetical protein POM88_027879 [Heracleum sosnowskyi]|uniref:Uncharacterized protein n=1 Tax=Heracleum sosnowskyi TaxID=360622 RepID=A0AAD8MLV4_9APIA|nr:hypothetical protein POM88_027879 [Heracleum sosnowskyi]